MTGLQATAAIVTKTGIKASHFPGLLLFVTSNSLALISRGINIANPNYKTLSGINERSLSI